VAVENFFAPVPARVQADARSAADSRIQPERSLDGCGRLRKANFKMFLRVDAYTAKQINLEIVLQLRMSNASQRQRKQRDQDRVQPSVHNTSFLEPKPYFKPGTELGQLRNSSSEV